MTPLEIAKGITGSAASFFAVGAGWFTDWLPAVKMVSMIVGIALSVAMTRYWWIKGNNAKKKKH